MCPRGPMGPLAAQRKAPPTSHVRPISGSLTGRMAPDQHVQAITVAIDQYAEKALGNRDYFLNKPYSVG
ncbi:hypothetical protein V1290_000229 [Bradyrhizobium sp. AZCC 1578]